MNAKGSEPHGRLKVLAAVKHSFSRLVKGIAGHRLASGFKFKIQSEAGHGRANIISLPSPSVSCTGNSKINRYLNSKTTSSTYLFLKPLRLVAAGGTVKEKKTVQ